MPEWLGIAWRVFATGACFAAFGVGGLILGTFVFPLLGLLVQDRERRTRLARRIISASFRAFIGMMRRAGVLTFEVKGHDRLQGDGRLILSNHPTLIDVVFLLALVAEANCIVKAALTRNPFTRGPVAAAGFIANDSGMGLVDDCVSSLKAGHSLIVFPEGTRTPDGGQVRLRRGAARIAVHGARDITPVRITCRPGTLRKGEKWWRVPPRRPHFSIEVCDTIAVAPFVAAAPSRALAARRLGDHLIHFYSTEASRATT